MPQNYRSYCLQCLFQKLGYAVFYKINKFRLSAGVNVMRYPKTATVKSKDNHNTNLTF